MNSFSYFPSALAHLLSVLFIMLGWHVIWLPNGMEVNNKWSHCKIILCKMDGVECLVSRISCNISPWVIHPNFLQCILCYLRLCVFSSCKVHPRARPHWHFHPDVSSKNNNWQDTFLAANIAPSRLFWIKMTCDKMAWWYHCWCVTPCASVSLTVDAFSAPATQPLAGKVQG